MNDQIKRSEPLFPIGVVEKLTELSARQIRYYEDHHLIEPARTDGNQRLFSYSDIERLLEIKSLLEQGVNISGIKKIFEMKNAKKEKIIEKKETKKEISNRELRQYLRNQLLMAGRQGRTSMIQGELSRFYH